LVTATLNKQKKFEVNQGETLLAAAARQHIQIAYSCQTGRCSTCKCKVTSGRTIALVDETGLSTDEKKEGWILSCSRTAIENVAIEGDDLASNPIPEVKTLPCRIQDIKTLAPDVLQVSLRLPPTAKFAFLAGQYINIIGPEGVRRSYSLASTSTNVLELHIRQVPNGIMSEYWFKEAKKNDLLRFRGPLGTFFLRNIAGRDLVFLATGTGIAPVKAMLEDLASALKSEQPNSISVYWGGRHQPDLYDSIKSSPEIFRYIPVLSRNDPLWNGAVGYVQNVFLASKPDLTNTTVYACGSNTMIKSAQDLLIAAGLPASRFHSDAFVCSASN
jgi:CDP-4-dehydro-6-deoxyglucose reductase